VVLAHQSRFVVAMKTFLSLQLLLVTSAVVTVVLAHPDHSDSWSEFKLKYNKKYQSEEDETYRQSVWTSTVEMISEHNAEFEAGEHTFNIGENELADLTPDEIKERMNGLVAPTDSEEDGVVMVTESELAQLNKTVDWRAKGYVTEVKNQAHCGSCWAFSATGSMEGAHFKSTGKLVSLSEQNLVDCSRKEHNMGCMGGLMDNAFKYVIANHGIDTEASYPYNATTGKTCKFNQTNIGANITSFTDIPRNSEMDLQKASATIGPISVGIDASRPTFHFYKSGVYHDHKCSSVHLDHGVLVVGYGQEKGKDYWLVKNSWGATWGEKGYIKMARNKKNACGIATQASYPVA